MPLTQTHPFRTTVFLPTNSHSAASLEKESGVALESEKVAAFRQAVLHGDWERVLAHLNDLYVGAVDRLPVCVCVLSPSLFRLLFLSIARSNPLSHPPTPPLYEGGDSLPSPLLSMSPSSPLPPFLCLSPTPTSLPHALSPPLSFWESEKGAAFRQAVLHGDWERVLAHLNDLNVGAVDRLPVCVCVLALSPAYLFLFLSRSFHVSCALASSSSPLHSPSFLYFSSLDQHTSRKQHTYTPSHSHSLSLTRPPTHAHRT